MASIPKKVVGAGEPPFVGVALGHNERIGWGLTIVGTDQEDVYVEQVNPANENEVKYNGAWEPLKIVNETIQVKGGRDTIVELKYSRHGPIFFEDKPRHLAYAVRRAAAQPGTAPYLGGLRLAQARNCREFLEAAMYWKAPTENQICGDIDDSISWRPAALSPARKGWTGRLPVPGTGQYEWQGFRKDLPSELNPARGFIATANHNINPPGYAAEAPDGRSQAHAARRAFAARRRRPAALQRMDVGRSRRRTPPRRDRRLGRRLCP